MGIFHNFGVPAATVLAVCLTAPGCGFFGEPTPDVDNPKTATISGFTLSHPGNWKTETDADTIEGTTITTLNIESKGSALTMIQVYEPPVSMKTDELFKMFMSGVSEAAEDEMGGMLGVDLGPSSEITKTVMDTEWGGRRGTFTVSLLGEKVPNTLEMLQYEDEQSAVLIFLQAPSEDWAKASPGFDQITGSFKKK